MTGYVKRLAKCCDTATMGDGETVMGLVGRFMQRLELVLIGTDHDVPPPVVELEGMVQPIPVPPVDPNSSLNLVSGKGDRLTAG